VKTAKEQAIARFSVKLTEAKAMLDSYILYEKEGRARGRIRFDDVIILQSDIQLEIATFNLAIEALSREVEKEKQNELSTNS